MMAHGVGAADWGDGKKPGVSWKSLRRILGYAKPYRKYIALTSLLVFATAGLGLVPPLLVRRAIDTSIPARDKTELYMLVGGMILLPVAGGLIAVAQNWGNTVIGNRMMSDIRNQLFGHLLRMPLRFYTTTRSGEITSRLTNDVNGVQQVVTTSFTNVMTNAVTVATTLAVMFWLNWQLTLLSIVVLPVFIVATVKVGDMRFRVGRRVQTAMSELTALVQEKLNISGLVLVKTFGREPQERTTFAGVSDELAKGQIAQSMVGRWFFMFASLFGSVSPALIYGYGGYLAINGDMSIGAIVAFVALVNRLFMPVSQLLTVHVDVAGSVALFERIFDYLDRPVEIEEKANALDLPAVQGSVAYTGVSFAYEPGRPVLNEVSFEAKPGQMVALVGPSGAGKTTVTYLLPRLYDPSSGAIAIDGHDVRDLTLASLSRHIGVVTQETYLFHATVRENLRYGKPDATDAELEAAAKAAYIHDVIAAMPKGYDTQVGERGYRLSGGEKQRLAIARIILKDPRILVLDEATSSLDSRSERLIKEALEPLLKTRTSLVIAHRLSTILAADQILVMDQGQIAERGTHAELLAADGLYAKIYNEQFKGGAVEVDTPLADEAPVPEPAANGVGHAAMGAGQPHGMMGGGGQPAGIPMGGGHPH
jgi:ATP-binding cassette subfamily B protein